MKVEVKVTNKKTPFKDNKNEIKYNLINSAIAGLLVFFGSFVSGSVTGVSILAAIAAACLAMVIKFKDYWSTQKAEYTNKLLSFI